MNNQLLFFLNNTTNNHYFVDFFIIFFAEPFPYLVVLFAILFLIFHHELSFKKNSFTEIIFKLHEVFFAFIVGFTAWAASVILKSFFNTLRPFHVYENINNLFYATGNAFPSGHATFFMALAFSIYFLHKRVGLFLILFALLIGTARIMAGVHYPVDILGGYVLGFILAVFFNFLRK